MKSDWQIDSNFLFREREIWFNFCGPFYKYDLKSMNDVIQIFLSQLRPVRRLQRPQSQHQRLPGLSFRNQNICLVSEKLDNFFTEKFFSKVQKLSSVLELSTIDVVLKLNSGRKTGLFLKRSWGSCRREGLRTRGLWKVTKRSLCHHRVHRVGHVRRNGNQTWLDQEPILWNF